jgi:hypothetical protein
MAKQITMAVIRLATCQPSDGKLTMPRVGLWGYRGPAVTTRGQAGGQGGRDGAAAAASGSAPPGPAQWPAAAPTAPTAPAAGRGQPAAAAAAVRRGPCRHVQPTARTFWLRCERSAVGYAVILWPAIRIDIRIAGCVCSLRAAFTRCTLMHVMLHRTTSTPSAHASHGPLQLRSAPRALLARCQSRHKSTGHSRTGAPSECDCS